MIVNYGIQMCIYQNWGKKQNLVQIITLEIQLLI